MIEKIIKRNGLVVPFDKEKIAFAVFRAAIAVGGRDRETAETIANEVVSLIEKRNRPGSYPTVEEVQDTVEKDPYRDRTRSNRKSLHSLPL